METVNGLYEAECIRTTASHTGPYKTLADVEYATAGWIDWYNNRRFHGTLGMITPVGARVHLLRGSQPRAATRIAAPENLGRFTLFVEFCAEPEFWGDLSVWQC